ncbi:MAG: glycosyltransferase family 2 protein [Anaerolineales bacterium]|nr:glycosyltransferase family 2 protein [Anaerolineales bacterium]
MSSTALIILNWNNGSDTIECLASVLKSDAEHFRIVLIDNGSTDDSVERILAWARGEPTAGSPLIGETTLPAPITVVEYDRAAAERGGSVGEEARLAQTPAQEQLLLVRIPENLGFAGGSNVGLRYALAAGFDYALLLNNDTVVTPTTLSRLVALMEDQPAIDAVTGQIRYYDRPHLIWNCGGSITWYGVVRYDYADAAVAETPQNGWRRIPFATGCALLLRASALRATGLLTERFFHGEEDFEFALRFRRAGRLQACRYDAVIYHKVSVSIRKAANDNLKRRTYLHYLNRYIDLRDYWPRLLWELWRYPYTVYVVLALWLRRRASLREGSQIGRSLLRETTKLNGVDKQLFERVLTAQAWLP